MERAALGHAWRGADKSSVKHATKRRPHTRPDRITLDTTAGHVTNRYPLAFSLRFAAVMAFLLKGFSRLVDQSHRSKTATVQFTLFSSRSILRGYDEQDFYKYISIRQRYTYRKIKCELNLNRKQVNILKAAHKFRYDYNAC